MASQTPQSSTLKQTKQSPSSNRAECTVTNPARDTEWWREKP